MAEELTDWKVQVTLDRRAIIDDIDKLVRVLARERIYYTIAASSRLEAMEKTRGLFLLHTGVPTRYVRSLAPRKLPT